MSARQLGDTLASQLYASTLKPLGFRKLRRTLYRERPGYIESFEIHGSSWNSGEEPWTFYLNVRVQFSGVAPLPGSSRARTYHADGRIERIVPAAPSKFEASSRT